jgi:MurNAc alpha-1-phosphate uridylyltransferase|tara:strand:+ start:1776 stop:2468 length:693 start_codon:yes stop_codon:yes gene_type:complete
MKIKTALILCAGFGKRLNPLTLKTPKPLININDTTLLQNTINLLEKLDIQNIKINTYYLQDQIVDFVLKNKMKFKIEIIKDGDKILDTGGGIFNLIKSSNEDDFIIFNPDTVWNSNYVEVIKNMIDFYYNKNLNNLLMVVNKNKSFDERFIGDFELKENKLLKQEQNNFIYTGCQIINKNLFKNIKDISFSILNIWNQQIKKEMLFGYESNENFVHITDLEIYKRLTKNN